LFFVIDVVAYIRMCFCCCWCCCLYKDVVFCYWCCCLYKDVFLLLLMLLLI